MRTSRLDRSVYIAHTVNLADSIRGRQREHLIIGWGAKTKDGTDRAIRNMTEGDLDRYILPCSPKRASRTMIHQ